MSFEGRLPCHVALGTLCEHQSPPQLSARVTLAHSVSDLAAATEDDKSLTVALTPDQAARNEALEFVARNSIMAVKRAEGQCLSCAVRLAHCVGALVVIS
jgi:4-alpha-glucanotransferase